jgi:hypothetical protein
VFVSRQECEKHRIMLPNPSDVCVCVCVCVCSVSVSVTSRICTSFFYVSPCFCVVCASCVSRLCLVFDAARAWWGVSVSSRCVCNVPTCVYVCVDLSRDRAWPGVCEERERERERCVKELTPVFERERELTLVFWIFSHTGTQALENHAR